MAYFNLSSCFHHVASLFAAASLLGRLITSFDDIEDIKLTKFDHLSGDIADSRRKANTALADHTGANDNDSKDLESDLHSNVLSDAADEASDSFPQLDSPYTVISSDGSTSKRFSSSSESMIGTALHSADVWCLSSALQDPSSFCTGLFFDAAISKGKSSNSGAEGAIQSATHPYDVLQPCYRLVETSILLCSKCASLFDSSLIVSDGINLNIFTCMSREAISIGLAYPCAAETLLRSNPSYTFNLSNPVVLHTKRHLLHSALKLQVIARYSSSKLSCQTPKILWRKKERENRFRSQLLSACATVARFEDHEHLTSARLAIDFDKIRTYSKEFTGERKSEGLFRFTKTLTEVSYPFHFFSFPNPSSYSLISYFLTLVFLLSSIYQYSARASSSLLIVCSKWIHTNDVCT